MRFLPHTSKTRLFSTSSVSRSAQDRSKFFHGEYFESRSHLSACTPNLKILDIPSGGGRQPTGRASYLPGSLCLAPFCQACQMELVLVRALESYHGSFQHSRAFGHADCASPLANTLRYIKRELAVPSKSLNISRQSSWQPGLWCLLNTLQGQHLPDS